MVLAREMIVRALLPSPPCPRLPTSKSILMGYLSIFLEEVHLNETQDISPSQVAAPAALEASQHFSGVHDPALVDRVLHLAVQPAGALIQLPGEPLLLEETNAVLARDCAAQ